MKNLVILVILLLCTSCYSLKHESYHNSTNNYTFERSKHDTHYYYVKNKQHYYESNISFNQLKRK
jgi:hypothetical protein